MVRPGSGRLNGAGRHGAISEDRVPRGRDEDRLLLVRRVNKPDAGLWGYPGGHVELGETVAEAAIRELREETNVEARASRVLTSLDVIRRREDGVVAHHYVLIAVLCDYLAGVPEAGDDAAEADWFAFGRVLSGDLPMSRNVDTVLRLALRREEIVPRDGARRRC